MLDPGQYSLDLYLDGKLLASGKFEIGSSSSWGVETLYQDDFDDASTGWNTYDTENAAAKYANGKFAILVKSAKWLAWTSPDDELDLKDVAIQVDATSVSGPGTQEYGVLCRYQDTKNFYFFVVTANGYARIVQVVAGTQTTISAPDKKLTPSEAVLQGDGETNYLEAVCQGDSLELYVNGELAAAATDSAIASGSVGLIVGTYDKGNARVDFDTLVVQKP
jgi:hypothetical protein